MDRTLRVGVAGVAHPNAGEYAGALSNIAGAVLMGVWDSVAQRAQAFAADYHCVHQAELSGLLAQIDALLVVSETAHHAVIVAQAAQAGVPVLCEPPLATTLGDARAMTEACKRSGVSLALAAPLRYHHALQQLRQAVQTGALGEILFIRAAGQRGYPAEAWQADPRQAGGGVLIERAAPLADLLRWIVGHDVQEVYAEIATHHPGGLVEDTALLMLTFVGGLRASLDPSWSRPASYAGQGDLSIEITGTAGVAQIDAFAQYVEVFSSHTHAARHGWGDDLARLMLAGWLQAVRAGGPVPASSADGVRALELMLAAYRSAELHAPVGL